MNKKVENTCNMDSMILNSDEQQIYLLSYLYLEWLQATPMVV
jgi:hypothetical protein